MSYKRSALKSACFWVAIVLFVIAGGSNHSRLIAQSTGSTLEPSLKANKTDSTADIYRRGVLRVLSIDYDVYAGHIGTNLETESPYYYFRPVRVVAGNSGKLYDSATKVLDFSVILDAPTDSLTLTMDGLQSFYQLKSGTAPNPVAKTPAAIRQLMQPFPFVSYRLELIYESTNGKTASRLIASYSDDPKRNEPIAIAEIPIHHSVADDTGGLHELLVQGKGVQLAFTATYQLKDYEVYSVRGELTQTAFNKASESVFGQGANGVSELLVERNASSSFTQEFSKQLVVVIEKGKEIDSDKVVSTLYNRLDQYFSNLKSLTVEDLQKNQQSVLLWTSEQARKELSADSFRTLTRDWEDSTHFRKVIETNWKKLADFDNLNESTSDYYKRLRENLKEGGELAGSVDVLGIGLNIKPDLRLHLDKDVEEVIRNYSNDIQHTRQLVQDEGDKKTDIIRDAYRKWTGEDFKEGTRAKSLNIVRVSKATIKDQLSAEFIQRTEVGTSTHERPVLVPLFSSVADQAAELAETNRDIDELKTKLEQFSKGYNLTLEKIAGHEEQIKDANILIGQLMALGLKIESSNITVYHTLPSGTIGPHVYALNHEFNTTIKSDAHPNWPPMKRTYGTQIESAFLVDHSDGLESSGRIGASAVRDPDLANGVIVTFNPFSFGERPAQFTRTYTLVVAYR
jgi:hypothetical protein